MLRRAFACLLLVALPLWAEPVPPQGSPGVTVQSHGIFCVPVESTLEPAPGTSLGYVESFIGDPVLRVEGPQVPASLGTSFGFTVVTDRDISQARIETWLPGSTAPEVWNADLTANVPGYLGFSFDFETELIPGLWRIEVWEGEQMLSRVEFDVLPPSQLPPHMSDCNLMS